MLKFRVTNTSQRTAKGARAVFLTEVGKLLKPGEQCVCNRLDNGTSVLAEAGVLKIEEGSFVKPPLFVEDSSPAPTPQVPVEKPVAAKPEPEPAPLPSPVEEPGSDSAEEEKPAPILTKKDAKAKKSSSKTRRGGRS